MPTFRPGFAFPFEELRDELDRAWSTLTASPPLRGWSVGPAEGVFPPVVMRESDEAITIEAELPGLEAGDVEITVAGDELLMKGSRPDTCPVPPASDRGGDGEKKGRVTWHRRERGTGAFERRITLPVAVDASRVEARLVDGVLAVTCPKAAECQPHKVAVRSA